MLRTSTSATQAAALSEPIALGETSGADMTARLDLVGLVVGDMARSLAFYRRLDLDIPPEADDESHVEFTLPGGLRLAWDTVDVVRSFSAWEEPRGGHRIGLAFLCGSPAEVDARHAAPGAGGLPKSPGAVRRVLGTALRHRAGPGRQSGRPVRAS